jgi:hypothetical protein
MAAGYVFEIRATAIDILNLLGDSEGQSLKRRTHPG